MVQIETVGQNGQFTVQQLVDILKVLRAPGGCPWDREQTHASIRNDMLEEAYEVVDAIDRSDKEALCEELGDVLLQVVFHAGISSEAGGFGFDEVVDGICRKLILRHPHVFGDATAESSGEVLDLWDNIKKKEKHQESYTETLKSVPTAFPALMRAAKVQKRAFKAGVDLGDPLASDRVEQQVDELKAATNADEIERAYGDLLFTLAGMQRTLGMNAEEALTRSVDRFIDRFEAAETADPADIKKAFFGN